MFKIGLHRTFLISTFIVSLFLRVLLYEYKVKPVINILLWTYSSFDRFFNSKLPPWCKVFEMVRWALNSPWQLFKSSPFRNPLFSWLNPSLWCPHFEWASNRNTVRESFFLFFSFIPQQKRYTKDGRDRKKIYGMMVCDQDYENKPSLEMGLYCTINLVLE